MGITILIPKYRDQPRPKDQQRQPSNAGKTYEEILEERKAKDPKVQEMRRRQGSWTEEQSARKTIEIMAKHEKTNAEKAGNGLITHEECKVNGIDAARRVRKKQNE